MLTRFFCLPSLGISRPQCVRLLPMPFDSSMSERCRDYCIVAWSPSQSETDTPRSSAAYLLRYLRSPRLALFHRGEREKRKKRPSAAVHAPFARGAIQRTSCCALRHGATWGAGGWMEPSSWKPLHRDMVGWGGGGICVGGWRAACACGATLLDISRYTCIPFQYPPTQFQHNTTQYNTTQHNTT